MKQCAILTLWVISVILLINQGGNLEEAIEDIEVKIGMAKVTLKSLPDRPGVAGAIFSLLGNKGFNIEHIAQSSTGRRRCDLSFAVDERELPEIISFLKENLSKIEAKEITSEGELATVTVYGRKLATFPGIAGKVFNLLANRRINIEMISASLSTISCLVKSKMAEEAVMALKQGLKGGEK